MAHRILLAGAGGVIGRRLVPLHADAAADAALLAVTTGSPGIYNVAGPNPHVSSEKAHGFRLGSRTLMPAR